MDRPTLAKARRKDTRSLALCKMNGKTEVQSPAGDLLSARGKVSSRVRVPKGRRVAMEHQESDSMKFATEPKLFKLSLGSPKALLKIARVRESCKRNEQTAQTNAEEEVVPDLTRERTAPPLKFFKLRKGTGKGKAFRADFYRKQFLRRELTEMDY